VLEQTTRAGASSPTIAEVLSRLWPEIANRDGPIDIIEFAGTLLGQSDRLTEKGKERVSTVLESIRGGERNSLTKSEERHFLASTIADELIKKVAEDCPHNASDSHQHASDHDELCHEACTAARQIPGAIRQDVIGAILLANYKSYEKITKRFPGSSVAVAGAFQMPLPAAAQRIEYGNEPAPTSQTAL
jgi:hypothetical protein